MKHIVNLTASLFAMICLLGACGTKSESSQTADNTQIELCPLDSILLSDPCILPDSATATYYMTGTGGLLWKSKDLKMWEGPYKVAQTDSTSWMGPNPMIWAAELHSYNGKYYYFATFTNQAVIIDTIKNIPIERRASHILVSDKPDGPYVPMKDKTYLYHYFNDTVYTYSNKKLTPAYVFNLNGYKYQFEELEIVADYTPKKPIDGPRMQLSNFVELEDFLFVPYTVAVPHRKLDEADTRLLIYDKKDKTLYADAQLVCTDTPALSLKKFDPLILSTDQKSFYTYKQAEDLADENLVEGLGPDDNPVLIKYSFR